MKLLRLIFCVVGVLCCSWAWGQSTVATDLRFRDLFVTPIQRGGLTPTATLLELSGKTVRMTGYMAECEEPMPGWFWMAPTPVHISERADGPANDLPAQAVMVLLPQAQSPQIAPHVRGLIQLTGVLRWGRHETADGTVSWVQLEMSGQP